MSSVIPPSLSTLTHVPLEWKGALNEESYPRIQLTPALGVQFDKTVNLKQILQLPQEERDAVLHDLAILGERPSLSSLLSALMGSFMMLTRDRAFDRPVSRNGVVFFQGQHDIVPEDIGRLALRLGELAGKPEDSTLHMCVLVPSPDPLSHVVSRSDRG